MSRRNGSTLVELVLSMTTGSVVMLLSIAVVHQTMQLTKNARHRDESNRALDRLALQFRRDIHLAREVSVEATAAMMIRNADGSLVSYTASGQDVVRERTGGTQKTRERYRLGDGSHSAFESKETGLVASVVVSNKTVGHENEPRIDLHIECTVARWLSLGSSIGAEE